MMIDSTPTPSSSRSATGSMTLPSVEPWSKRRAIQPSTQSVAPSTASSTAAAPRRSAPNSSHTNHGTQHSRTSVMALGTVTMRASRRARST